MNNVEIRENKMLNERRRTNLLSVVRHVTEKVGLHLKRHLFILTIYTDFNLIHEMFIISLNYSMNLY